MWWSSIRMIVTSNVPPPRSKTKTVWSRVELVEAVGQRRRGRLVDDLEHIEPGELAGVQRGRALGVVEIRRHRDHRVGHRFAEVFLRVVLELLDDERRELLGGIDLAVELAVELRLALAHLALHEIDDLLRLGHGVLLGQRADDGVRAVEEDDRRRDALALGVRE